MVVETCHVSEEAGFKHHLPMHGNPCWAAWEPMKHLQPVAQITGRL